MIASELEINPLWLYDQTYEQTEDDEGEIESTTFTWVVLYSDTYSSISPSDIIDLTDLGNEVSALIIEDINDDEFTNASNISWDSLDIVAGTAPGWAEEPDLEETDTDEFEFTATLDANGYIFVTCYEEDDDDELLLTEHQVMFGLDPESNAADGWAYAAVTANTELSLTVDGLDEDEDYECQFIACNDDPLWPTCENFANVTPIVLDEQTDDDFAGYLTAGLAVLLALILN